MLDWGRQPRMRGRRRVSRVFHERRRPRREWRRVETGVGGCAPCRAPCHAPCQTSPGTQGCTGGQLKADTAHGVNDVCSQSRCHGKGSITQLRSGLLKTTRFCSYNLPRDGMRAMCLSPKPRHADAPDNNDTQNDKQTRQKEEASCDRCQGE